MADTKTKTPATPEQKLRTKASRMIGLTNWRQEWRAENPEGTKEERKAAWTAVRRAETKKARKALKVLEKGGIKLVAEKA